VLALIPPPPQIFVDTVGDPDTYQRVLSSNFPRHKHIQWTVCSKADAIYPIVGAASIAAKVTRDRWIEGWKYAEVGLGEPQDDVVETIIDEKPSSTPTEPLLDVQPKSPSKKRPKASSSTSPRKKQRFSTLAKIAPSSSGFWRMGSGYPGDPETQRYLMRTLDPVFGWPCIVRFSWQTAKTMMEEKVAGKTQRPTRAIENASGEAASSDHASPYGTRASTHTRCHSIRWNDEPAKITNFFQKAAMQSQQKSAARISDFAARHRKARIGLAKDLSIQSIGPDSF
jgi:ribonuclease H2 subunit A